MIKKRINGRHLGQAIGDQVILLGTVTKLSSSGRNVELETTDGVTINVTLPDAIEVNPEGYLEVHGTVQSKSTMACSSYVHFPPNMTAQFDKKQYNDLLMILNVLGEKKWQLDGNHKSL